MPGAEVAQQDTGLRALLHAPLVVLAAEEMVVHQRLLQLTAFQEPQILAAAAEPVEATGAQMVRLVPAAPAS
jgi:hypothetical protein